jgi:hypothetical protein
MEKYNCRNLVFSSSATGIYLRFFFFCREREREPCFEIKGGERIEWNKFLRIDNTNSPVHSLRRTGQGANHRIGTTEAAHEPVRTDQVLHRGDPARPVPGQSQVELRHSALFQSSWYTRRACAFPYVRLLLWLVEKM